MALTKNDLKDIKSIVTDAVNKAVSDGVSELARTVKHGFDAVDKRLDVIGADVDALRWKVDNVKKHLGTIEDAFAMPVELRFAARKRQRPLKKAS